MEVNPGIFKAYDIRGIYPTELNEEVGYAIGRAFASFLQVDKVIVGRDMRLSGHAHVSLGQRAGVSRANELARMGQPGRRAGDAARLPATEQGAHGRPDR